MMKMMKRVLLAATVSLLVVNWGHAQEGVTVNTIRLGGVMDLEGRSSGLGQGMKRGIEAALEDQLIGNRRIEFITENDSYTPSKTIEGVNKLVGENIFAMIGNVGTPTAKVALPILAKSDVPAIGFFTGAGLLRPGVGEVVNFRASYVQETAAVIKRALQQGILASEVCAYVQNDAYGMAGVQGIANALESEQGTSEVIDTLNQILGMEGVDPERNGVGPVGVYKRNTFTSKDGYKSLKAWEEKAGTTCKLVVAVGTYNAIARFGGYSRYKGDNWLISAVSFTGAENFQRALNEFGINEGILMTQVVPLRSGAPIIQQARQKLGEDFGYVTLEGFIVGKMWLYYMNQIQGPPSRQAFLDVVKGSITDLGGLTLDFSSDNQGSDFVAVTYLDGEDWESAASKRWSKIFSDQL